MKITYSKHGDYYLPDLTINSATYEIGKFGRMYQRYLKQHDSVFYSELLMTGKLTRHIADIDSLAQQTYESVIEKLMLDAPPKEEQMEWVGFVNNARNCAEEIVLKEIIYPEVGL